MSSASDCLTTRRRDHETTRKVSALRRGDSAALRRFFPSITLSLYLSIILCLALGFVAVAAAMTPETAGQLFNQGNAKFRDKDYTGAVELYQQVLDSGTQDRDLYYNAGCAYFRVGDYGRAILNFERAARLAPRDKDIVFNLTEAGRYTIDKIDPVYDNFLIKAAHWLLFYLSKCEWIFLLSALFTLFCLCFTLRVWFAGRRIGRWLRWILWASGMLLVLAVALVILRWRDPVENRRAVIIESKVDVVSGPAVPEVSMTIHSGTRLLVDEDREGFYRIRLDDGRVGWVPKASVAKVVGP